MSQKTKISQNQPEDLKTQEFDYPALQCRKCSICAKEKNVLLDYTPSIRHICKDCTNSKKRAKRHAEGTDPKLKWRSVGKHL